MICFSIPRLPHNKRGSKLLPCKFQFYSSSLRQIAYHFTAFFLICLKIRYYMMALQSEESLVSFFFIRKIVHKVTARIWWRCNQWKVFWVFFFFRKIVHKVTARIWWRCGHLEFVHFYWKLVLNFQQQHDSAVISLCSFFGFPSTEINSKTFHHHNKMALWSLRVPPTASY